MLRVVRAFFLGLLLSVLFAVPSSADSPEVFEFRPLRSTIGMSLALPALTNLTVAYYAPGPFGLQVSGGYLPFDDSLDLRGIEGSLLLKLGESRHQVHQLLASAGVTQLRIIHKYHDFTYFGIGYGYITHRLNFSLTGIVTEDGPTKYGLSLSFGFLFSRIR